VLDAIEAVRIGGTVVLAGIKGGTSTVPIDTDRLVYKEISLRGVFTQARPAYEQAIALLARSPGTSSASILTASRWSAPPRPSKHWRRAWGERHMHLDLSLSAALDDREQVIESAYRLFRALDTRWWDALTAACEDDVKVEWGAAEGPILAWSGGAAFGAGAEARFGHLASLHQATNPLLELDGDGAELRLLVAGRHRAATLRGADSCIVHAEHRQILRRRDGRWRITAIWHEPIWTEGNPGILTAALPPLPSHAERPFAPDPPATTDTERLQRLADRAAIHDLMMRFGRGLDRKDWALYRSCFADRLMLDFSQTTGRPPHEVEADEFVAFARLRQRLHAAFHQYSNFQLSIEGDRARCILYLVARHRVAESGGGDPLNVFVGWYENEFARTPQGWRIVVLRHPLQWIEGNALIKDAADPEVEDLARRLFAQGDAA
jgi:hypothetical protein